MPEEQFTREQYNTDYELKTKGLENMLGEMYKMVGHAIIPFEFGGTVDMYYFLHHLKGTGFATMELLDPDGNGPQPNEAGTYELVAFTKELYNTDQSLQTPFNLIERRICSVFTSVGDYAFTEVLEPGDTFEIPADNEEDYNYLIFDDYKPYDREFKIGEKKHHLLLCMELFKSEMEFSRANGSDKLFELLKARSYYPYSDLDRDPVA